MSHDVDADMGVPAGAPSWEELGHKMYSKDHVKFHTEIDRPDPMTAMDVTAEFVAAEISPKAGKFMLGYNAAYRDNMVAYQRKRAHETEEMVKANVQAEKEKASVKEMMLGLQR